MINGNGEYANILQGIYENYLKCKITDMGGSLKNSSKLEQACEWLLFFDGLDYAVKSKQLYEFSPYLGYSLAKFHQLFASPLLKFRIEYPKMGFTV